MVCPISSYVYSVTMTALIILFRNVGICILLLDLVYLFINPSPQIGAFNNSGQVSWCTQESSRITACLMIIILFTLMSCFPWCCAFSIESAPLTSDPRINPTPPVPQANTVPLSYCGLSEKYWFSMVTCYRCRCKECEVKGCVFLKYCHRRHVILLLWLLSLLLQYCTLLNWRHFWLLSGSSKLKFCLYFTIFCDI